MESRAKTIAVKGSGVIAHLCSLMLSKSGLDVIHIKEDTFKKNDMFFAISPSSIDWFKGLDFPSIFFEKLHKISEIDLHSDILQEKINFSADDNFIESLAFMAKQDYFHDVFKVTHKNINAVNANKVLSYIFKDQSIDLILEKDKLSCSLIVVCDDNDPLIKKEEFHSTSKDYHQTAFTFIFNSKEGFFDKASQFFYEDSILALLPLKSNEIGVVWSCNEQLKKHLESLDEKELVNYLQNRIDRKFLIEIPLKQKNMFALKDKYFKSILSKRLVLIGDAAHKIHPMAGQGLNLGLRDLRYFEEIISSAHNCDFGDINFLRKYERRRRKDVSQFLNLTSILSDLIFEHQDNLKKISANKILSGSINKLLNKNILKKYLVKQATL